MATRGEPTGLGWPAPDPANGQAPGEATGLGWPGAGTPSPGRPTGLGWPDAADSDGAEPDAAGPAATAAPATGERATAAPEPAPAPAAAEPTAGPRRRRRWLVVTAVAVVVVVAAAAAVVGYGPERLRAFGSTVSPTPTPTVPSPTPTTVPPALATPAATATPDAAAVRSRLAALLASKDLGKGFGGYVVDPVTGATLAGRRGNAAVTPASTAKLATTSAALASLGPDARFTTRVVRTKGGVTIVGGGDPTLLGPGRQPALPAYPRYARLTALAAQTAKALRSSAGKAGGVRVRVDDSLFSGPRLGPGWKPNYVPEGSVAPVDALMIDHGRADPRRSNRVADPGLAAGDAFAALLAKHGVAVKGKVARKKAAPDAPTLAQVQSPTVGELVEETLTNSDNDMAEALARHVALKEGQPASFAGGSAAVHTVLARLGIASGISLKDGSGLSPEDRVTARALARVLQLAASGKHPDLGSVLTGLPVGGYTGTLTDRFAQARGGVGVVRAKTGTLDGVSGLAGYVLDRDGRVIVFAFVANGFPMARAAQAHLALDRLAAALASCGCS